MSRRSRPNQGIGEQDTKAALIVPVLRSLGWDVEDLEEVKLEYRRRSSDNPVDYALFVSREARLFIEAKSLASSLSDPKWANQMLAYAMAAGVAGFIIGYLATRSSVEKLDVVVIWGALLAATIRWAIPLLFAALGGLFSERSGVINIGLEGMMLMGSFFSVWGADVTGSWPLGVLIGLASGAVMGLIK